MCATFRSPAACITLFALVLWIAPLPTQADSGKGAGLEGRVLGLDGRVAEGHRIHLIGAGGEDLLQSAVDEDGLYSFTGLDAGRYSLGIETPGGRLAPVAAPPFRLGGHELARRDLKLLASDAESTNAALQANYGLGSWWNGLSTTGKAWTIVGVVLAGWLIYEALDEDDEPSASPA